MVRQKVQVANHRMIVFVHENNVKKCDARLQLGGTAADERTENTAKHPTMKLLDTENLVPHPTARAAIQRIPWHTHYVSIISLDQDFARGRPGANQTLLVGHWVVGHKR